MKKLSNFPYHFMILSVFPVISLYVHNFSQVPLRDIWRILAIYLCGSIFLFGLFLMFIKDKHKTSLIITIGILIFTSLVPIQSALIEMGIQNFSRLLYLLPIGVILFSCVTILIMKKKIHEGYTKWMNVFAISTLVLPSIQLFTHLYNTSSKIALERNAQQSFVATHLGKNEHPPDVYYIVLDMHGREDRLFDEFGYDSSNFTERLTEMDFYVARCSNANYPSATWQSMNATLNMDYINDTKFLNKSPSQVLDEAYLELQNNKVFRSFKEIGYYLVSFRTTYKALNFPNSDFYIDSINFPGTKIKMWNQFEILVLKRTPLGVLTSDNLFNWEKIHYMNIKEILKNVSNISLEIPSPKFVYLHLMIPHYPYVFSSTGDYIEREDAEKFTSQGYVEQVNYIDNQILSIAKKLIDQSVIPPIIIIQGDHGFNKGDTDNLAGILNAYYLPKVTKEKFIYPTITPVNTFRLLFNLYFGGDYALLEDEIYLDPYQDFEHKEKAIPYEFIPYYVKHKCES
jgi:hypothetical protein